MTLVTKVFNSLYIIECKYTYDSLSIYSELSAISRQIFFQDTQKVTNMKLLVRASILSVAGAGLIAGFAPNRASATAQNVAFSHQVVSSALPAPRICGPTTDCGIGH